MGVGPLCFFSVFFYFVVLVLVIVVVVVVSFLSVGFVVYHRVKAEETNKRLVTLTI